MRGARGGTAAFATRGAAARGEVAHGVVARLRAGRTCRRRRVGRFAALAAGSSRGWRPRFASVAGAAGARSASAPRAFAKARPAAAAVCGTPCHPRPLTPGKELCAYAGRECALAMARGSTDPKDIGVADVSGCSPEELKRLDDKLEELRGRKCAEAGKVRGIGGRGQRRGGCSRLSVCLSGVGERQGKIGLSASAAAPAAGAAPAPAPAAGRGAAEGCWGRYDPCPGLQQPAPQSPIYTGTRRCTCWRPLRPGVFPCSPFFPRSPPQPPSAPQVVAMRGVDPEELAASDGSDPGRPILISIRGTVYDVSKGRDFYGPGGGRRRSFWGWSAGLGARRGRDCNVCCCGHGLLRSHRANGALSVAARPCPPLSPAPAHARHARPTQACTRLRGARSRARLRC